MKYLWAAYRMGTWKGQGIPEDMDREQFVAFVDGVTKLAQLYVLSAPVNGETKPVGVLYCREDEVLGAIEPHLEWFKWASPRNKIEAIARGVLSLQDFAPLIVKTAEENDVFFTHICKYGILRRVGKFFGSSGKVFIIFQSRKKWEVS